MMGNHSSLSHPLPAFGGTHPLAEGERDEAEFDPRSISQLKSSL
jgi:hypothetical protein